MYPENSKSLGVNSKEPILIGSAFPLSLIRRRVEIEPCGLDQVRAELRGRPIASFWGHANTLALANSLLGVNVAPRVERPAVVLNSNQLPTLDGVVFTECVVLSPDFVSGFRPKEGETVGADKIIGWQVLRMEWT